MFAAEIRRAVEAAPRVKLPEVAALMWRAYSDGHVSEAEAEALSGLIEARQMSKSPYSAEQSPNPTETLEERGVTSGRPGRPRSRAGSRPRSDASMARRRRWAASGRLPPALAARFTLAEQAVLAVVAVEVTKRGWCALAIGAVAALAGVSETSVRRALREARTLGLVTIDERRLSRFRNDTNVVAIIDRAWIAWLRLARKVADLGGGCQTRQGTNTPVSYPVNSEGRSGQKGIRGTAADPAVRVPSRTRETGRTGSARR